uniref:Secreted protein n=1 Tax=Junco hyemalis TaxID=40217 RepID=A0A8C5JR64_JUNHY
MNVNLPMSRYSFFLLRFWGSALMRSPGMRGMPVPKSLSQFPAAVPFRKDTSDCSERASGPSQLEAPCLESASREAYFSRVETFTISFGMLQFRLGSWGNSQRGH